MESGILHAWLAVGEGSGQFFLEDVVEMLRGRARRAGIAVSESGSRAAAAALPGHSFDSISGGLLARLADEVGLHRAQFVSSESSTGRVETAIVAVEFLKGDEAARQGRPDWPIVKTYNYVLGSCVRHATGKVSTLTGVLMGDD